MSKESGTYSFTGLSKLDIVGRAKVAAPKAAPAWTGRRASGGVWGSAEMNFRKPFAAVSFW